MIIKWKLKILDNYVTKYYVYQIQLSNYLLDNFMFAIIITIMINIIISIMSNNEYQMGYVLC